MTTSPERPADPNLARHQTIDLTTIGRRSGVPSRIEIWWFQVGGRFVITGTPGRRDWYANILANPEEVIHVAGWDLPATARPVVDPEIRAAVFDSPRTRWLDPSTAPPPDRRGTDDRDRYGLSRPHSDRL